VKHAVNSADTSVAESADTNMEYTGCVSWY